MSHPRQRSEHDAAHPYDSILGSMAQGTNRPLFASASERIAAEYQPGAVLNDQYEIKKCLGQGGMGIVFLARDQMFEKDVALKMILPDFVDAAQARQRFLNEMRMLRELYHENIVRAYSGHIDKRSGLPYIVMEYIEGESLAEYVARQGGRLELNEVVAIMDQICAGLSVAHPKLVHRDLKPQNIFRQENGRVKILDFGLAKALDEDGYTRTRIGMGTPRYLSPEQANDAKRVDHRSDIYSLGVMLYEFLTGALTVGNFDPASRSVPGIPKKVDRVISKALARQDQRYESVTAFMEDLRQAARPSRLGRRIALAVAALLLVAGAAAGAYLLWESGLFDRDAAVESTTAARVETPSATEPAPVVEVAPPVAVPVEQPTETPEATDSILQRPEEPSILQRPAEIPEAEASTSPESPAADTEAESAAEPSAPVALPEIPSAEPPIRVPRASAPVTVETPPAEQPAPADTTAVVEPAPRPEPVRVATRRPSEPTPAIEEMDVPEPTLPPPSTTAARPGPWLRPDLGLQDAYVEGSPFTFGISGGPTDAEYEWYKNGRSIARGINRQSIRTTLDQTGPLELRVVLRREGAVIAEAAGTSTVTPVRALPWEVPVEVEFTVELPSGFNNYEWLIDGTVVSTQRTLRHTLATPGRYRIDGYARNPASSNPDITYVHKALDTTATEWR